MTRSTKKTATGRAPELAPPPTRRQTQTRTTRQILVGNIARIMRQRCLEQGVPLETYVGSVVAKTARDGAGAQDAIEATLAGLSRIVREDTIAELAGGAR